MIEIFKKLRLGLLGLIIVAVFASLAIVNNSDNNYPTINGAIIPHGRALDPFVLQDHFGLPFSNDDLLGKWHLISYGYTHCPDICPITLQVLTQLKNRLANQPDYSDLQVLFYSVDHERDTVAQLYQYMPFFHQEFIGLTADENHQQSARAFESSLGIKAILEPLDEAQKNEFSGEYSVSHGVMLYLSNPAGRLQAVFQPQRDEMGVQHFSADKVLQDYIAVRDYF